MSTEEIRNRIQKLKEHYTDVKIKLQILDGNSHMVIMQGGFEKENPTEYMNEVVSCLVEHELHNEFIEKFLDNPWIRVVFFEFNDIQVND